MDFDDEKKLLIWLAILLTAGCLLVILCSGCRTNKIRKIEYYESGKIKSEYTDDSEGMLEWSSGDHKTVNLPLSSVSAIGVGK